MEEVQRDLPFFRRSGGGVTLGGGEPLFQAQFASEVLEACRDQGIDTALETCGYAPWPVVSDLCGRVDHVLFDVKHIDPGEHDRLTGVDNTRILANLEELARIHPDVVVRYPLIPGLNDSDAHVTRLARFLRGLKGVRLIEVLPYHRYGERKYEMLGRSYPLAGTAIPSASEVEHVCELVLAEGLECSRLAT
jgi:pyruvate formate lyase activating enzyme